MTADRLNRTAYFCGGCQHWFVLIRSVHASQPDNVGKCHSTDSDHNQHLVGYKHPACSEFIGLKERLEAE